MFNLISRGDAKLAGLKRYYHGRPCVNGHDCERYTSTGGCVACLDPVWRQVKGQIGITVFKTHLQIPASTTLERRVELGRWLQDACIPAFFAPKEPTP